MLGQTLAHYQITEKLGEGGMGAVYRARDTNLDRDVALKILPKELSGDPERAARFEREARTLASLQHPHVASIYGYEQAEGIRFLAMELVEGEDLAERLTRGPIPVDEVVRLGQQIALGMEAAHERGIVHRDLKPANIRIDREGTAKVLDFGLARAYTGDPGDDPNLTTSPTITAAMTQVGTILGTAAYMSPEQARGKPIDKRSDIWSFGVILYEMLTGKQLYQGETVTDILGAIVHRTPDMDSLPAKTPPGLRHLIQRCLAPDVADRLRDIGEARIALANPEEATSSAPAPVGTASGGRPWWILSLVLLAALAVVSIRAFQPPPAARVIQAAIPMPAGHALRTMGSVGGSMRFSPDGNQLAMVVQSAGTSQIWVRGLDEREARPVQGTEGGHRPFWSPDGKSLGFFYRGHLRRVPVEGGGALTIAEAADGRGGTWLPDGTIVFAPSPTSSLLAVPAAGGEPRQVTDSGSYSHREPRSLGLDDRFLFLENRTGGQWFASVGYLDGRPHQEVVLSGGGTAFAGGHLFFLRGTTLVAQPFDPQSAQLSGEPVPIAEGIVRDIDYGVGAFSVSEHDLVYQAGQGVEARLVVLDRQGDVVQTIGEPASYSQVAVSPDETTVATLVEEADGGSDLWIVEMARGTRRRFTFNTEGVALRRTQPTWTPDGRRMVYTRESDGEVQIYAKDAGGSGEEEPLLRIPGEMLWVYDISPDGRWVLFGRESVGTSSAEDLWLLSLSGDGELRPVLETPFDEWPGRFSPDGRWIAIDSDESGRREIFVVSFPEMRGKRQVSREGGRFPQWNGDGTELFYQDPAGGLVAVPVDGSGDSLEVGEPQRLFQAFMISGTTSDYATLQNGERFLLVEQALQEAPMTLVLNWMDALESR